MENTLLTVSDFVSLLNQTLEYAYPSVFIEGEVTEFKISQGKWIYFKLKDEESTVDCFMPAWQLRMPIEDGMKVVIVASAKLTKWGRFSLTVKSIKPSGQGAIKKSFELLKAKLDQEGLFSAERKRSLPEIPTRVAVVSSTEAAGYADFIKIINDRWGGLQIDVAHVQVQGEVAADQIIRAVEYFNQLEDLPEVIVVIRGGGSADDLAVFNDEKLVRAVAGSRVPTLVGIGHEVDETLIDLVADVRAATPSNAAQILVPDRREVVRAANAKVASAGYVIVQSIEQFHRQTKEKLGDAYRHIMEKLDYAFERLAVTRLAIAQLNPATVLERGYALIRGDVTVGSEIEIETSSKLIKAEVKDVKRK